jgi:hypothetical protein
MQRVRLHLNDSNEDKLLRIHLKRLGCSEAQIARHLSKGVLSKDEVRRSMVTTRPRSPSVVVRVKFNK